MNKGIKITMCGFIGLVLGAAVMPLVIWVYYLYGGVVIEMPSLWAFITVVLAILGAVIGYFSAKNSRAE